MYIPTTNADECLQSDVLIEKSLYCVVNRQTQCEWSVLSISSVQ